MFGAKACHVPTASLAPSRRRASRCFLLCLRNALRFTQSPRAGVDERIQADGCRRRARPAPQAILEYSAKLTRDPAAVGPADAAPLRSQGLTDLEILDLTHAVAMFAWATG